MSKGSRRRPRQVSREQFEKNWDAAFSIMKRYNILKHIMNPPEENKPFGIDHWLSEPRSDEEDAI